MFKIYTDYIKWCMWERELDTGAVSNIFCTSEIEENLIRDVKLVNVT